MAECRVSKIRKLSDSSAIIWLSSITSGVVELEAAVKPEQFKKEAVEEEMKTWREKKMHGQFLRQLDEVGVDIKGTWNCLKKADLKSSVEALICATQEQALRTHYVKFRVDKSVESPLCRICHAKGECYPCHQ